MARKQISMNIPRDVERWMVVTGAPEGITRTQWGLAGLIRLRFSSEAEWIDALQWARMLDDGLVNWPDVEGAADQTLRERAQTLKSAVDRSLEDVPEEPQERRKAHRRRGG